MRIRKAIIPAAGLGTRFLPATIAQPKEMLPMVDNLAKKGKDDLASQIERVSTMARIHFIRQRTPKGLGDAVLHAESFVDNEPFLVLLGDSIVQQERPCSMELISAFLETGKSIMNLETVPDEEVSRYGIAAINPAPIDLNNGDLT
ncbi:MAG: UTP-glucose-1-phosphate uridylyltransferase [Berkelbacteria bacterium GW2011_GWA2_38_9]|uniref:UTP--glucose-1-phosphate uridylyltransferase n=1 Tax=Berkelbacteria bacterium GW2011_GWA2_38_9 TaxID=1618334 RepID=A0A0G0L6I5_9BACT|nr:MAG: UTP-glucose-1-phosphate uridylyltransferase [Berkelbacteria bacterium GW2011_GWA2_38_9]